MSYEFFVKWGVEIWSKYIAKNFSFDMQEVFQQFQQFKFHHQEPRQLSVYQQRKLL